MPSNGDARVKDAISASGISKSLDGSTMFIGLIKRFFYQVLGIYTPAAIMFLYLLPLLSSLTAKEPSSNQMMVYESLKNGQTFEILLFVIGSVIVGEVLNVITSTFTTISPVDVSVEKN